jgi:hypothetical protein
MSAQNFGVFAPESLIVVSGLDGVTEVDCLCAAWVFLDLGNLSVPAVSFDNRPAPGVPGSNELPGIEDELRTSLPFQISGTHDRDGELYPTARTGMRRNWAFLTRHLFLPSEEAALDATYHSEDPDEDPYDFRIQFAGVSISTRSVGEMTGTVQVILPDGALVNRETGS